MIVDCCVQSAGCKVLELAMLAMLAFFFWGLNWSCGLSWVPAAYAPGTKMALLLMMDEILALDN